MISCIHPRTPTAPTMQALVITINETYPKSGQPKRYSRRDLRRGNIEGTFETSTEGHPCVRHDFAQHLPFLCACTSTRRQITIHTTNCSGLLSKLLLAGPERMWYARSRSGCFKKLTIRTCRPLACGILALVWRCCQPPGCFLLVSHARQRVSISGCGLPCTAAEGVPVQGEVGRAVHRRVCGQVRDE